MDAVYRFSGVKRFEDLDNMRPTAVYGETDGMLSGNIMRIFEDSRGDMWFSPWVRSKRLGLSRWSRATGKFDSFQHENGLPKNGAASAFAEDNSGGGWFGFIENGISRFRDGKYAPGRCH
jgi:ligand-binding sensor domain-containing protein